MSKKNKKSDIELLEKLKKNYKNYRIQWRENPKRAINNHLNGKIMQEIMPQLLFLLSVCQKKIFPINF